MCINNQIITPYDSNIKYKLFHNKIYFSKVLNNSLRFPYNSGIFQNTVSISNKTLKSIILIKHPLAVGTYINIKIIGGLSYNDNRGFHHRLIVIPCNGEEDDISKISSLELEEIKNFFIYYNKMYNRKIKSLKFFTKNEGDTIYNNAKLRFSKNEKLKNIINAEDKETNTENKETNTENVKDSNFLHSKNIISNILKKMKSNK